MDPMTHHALPLTLHVEPTSRCNLACAMCPKQAEGCRVPDEDLPLSLFRRVLPGLARARSLVLTGFGEPLLHPDLAEMIALAREAMPRDAQIGFQSNAMLLDRHVARALLQAGLTRLCVSVETVGESADARDPLHGGPFLAAVEAGLDALAQARALVPKTPAEAPPFEFGLQFVLMRSTLPELPGVIRFAARHGAAFVLASHVLPYRAEDAAESLFCPDTEEARALYDAWRERAAREGLDLSRAHGLPWKYAKTAEDLRLLELTRGLLDEAKARGMTLNLTRLASGNHAPSPETRRALAKAAALAGSLGVRLDLPPLFAAPKPSCQFIAGCAAVVTADGAVGPCLFTARDLVCHPLGKRKRVARSVFGRLEETGFLDIWNAPGFVRFREEAAAGMFADCFACNLEPCADVDGDIPFVHDCQGSIAPCCHCPWSQGGLRCLG